MEYIYSAMLLHKAGKEITEEAVKKVLTAAGVAVEEVRVKALVATLKSIDIDEAIRKAAVVAPAVVASVAAVAAPAAEAKKEEKTKEDEKKAEEAAAAGLGALFG